MMVGQVTSSWRPPCLRRVSPSRRSAVSTISCDKPYVRLLLTIMHLFAFWCSLYQDMVMA